MKPHPTQKTNFPVRCFLSGPCTSGPSGPKWENYKHRLHQIFQSGLMIFINQPPSIQFPWQILRRALLYLAIRSWTVAVVLDLAVLWTWGLIARNILEDQIPFNQIELSLAPTRDSYWIDLRNILRKPWFVASNILWGFRFQFSDPIVRCTAHLITPGGESTSTKSSIHLCRGFPNRFYPWIQLPSSHKKSTIKLVSYTSYTWLVIYEIIRAALKYHIKLVTYIRYTD